MEEACLSKPSGSNTGKVRPGQTSNAFTEGKEAKYCPCPLPAWKVSITSYLEVVRKKVELEAKVIRLSELQTRLHQELEDTEKKVDEGRKEVAAVDSSLSKLEHLSAELKKQYEALLQTRSDAVSAYTRLCKTHSPAQGVPEAAGINVRRRCGSWSSCKGASSICPRTSTQQPIQSGTSWRREKGPSWRQSSATR